MRTLAPAALAALIALAACTPAQRVAEQAPSDPITLRLGLLYTTGGKGGALASAVLGSASLAVEAAAERFNVTLELVDADYAGDLEELLPAEVDRLRGESDAIVVATDDPAVAPALDGIRELPVVHAFIADDGLIEGKANAFRVAPTNRLAARTLIEHLVERREYDRIALLTDDTDFGTEGARDLRAALADAGVEPVVDRTFEPGGDIHTPVMDAGGRGAQALVIWVDSPGEAARIVVEAHRMRWAYQIVLSPNLATETFAKNASAQVTPVAFRDGMLSVGTWAGPWFNLARIIDFYTTFRTQNSALAPVSAATVFDAIMALAAAAREAGGADTGAMVRALEALEEFEGAGVPITFTADDHEGIDRNDMAILGFTKSQDSAGGEFFPEVDTGGGFFTVVSESLRLPERYAFLVRME